MTKVTFVEIKLLLFNSFYIHLFTVMYYIVLSSTVLYCPIQYCTFCKVQYYTVEYRAVQCNRWFLPCGRANMQLMVQCQGKPQKSDRRPLLLQPGLGEVNIFSTSRSLVVGRSNRWWSVGLRGLGKS